ncbi:hypothetical protein B296_00013823 [Ensete ventricosum]|uniref:Uncharacterized protein n=1 Tax=Ensete ventricosum TaxID=4639 RepID=A0A426XTW6_ENSVE|nr:hypothetical protein B296_00013823 [Ensete ventricosum]
MHPRLNEVSWVGKSIASSNTIPFTISGKGPEYLTNTRVQKNMSNKSDIYRKHM